MTTVATPPTPPAAGPATGVRAPGLRTTPPRLGARRPGRRGLSVVANAVAVVFGLAWLFPVYWMLNTAFLTDRQIQQRVPVLFPVGGTGSHFAQVLSSPAFWSAMRMSLAIALVVVLGAMVFGFFASLALSRFRFRGRTQLIVAVLVVQMIPAEALFISQYRMLDGWGLLNSVAGMSLLYLGASIPFTIWMLKGFVDGVPVELEEAAMLDGCSRMGAFLRITFPLLGSGLVASSIFAFLASWNEYTLALVALTSDDSRTLPLWLTSFSGQNQVTDWGAIMAGSTLMAVPVVILFMTVQKRMASGLTAGAVK